MSSTCFEPEGPSSGRRLYVQALYSVSYMQQYSDTSANEDNSFRNRIR